MNSFFQIYLYDNLQKLYVNHKLQGMSLVAEEEGYYLRGRKKAWLPNFLPYLISGAGFTKFAGRNPTLVNVGFFEWRFLVLVREYLFVSSARLFIWLYFEL